MKLFRTHRYHGRFILLLVAVSLLAACSTTPRKRGGGVELQSLPPITAVNADAQRGFDAGVEALQAGRYQEAEQAFLLIGAEYPDDAIATMAELYVARAQMGDIEKFARQSASKANSNERQTRPNSPRQILSSLMEGEDVDDRVRYAARAYYSVELALSGEQDPALAALKPYPGASISPAVLEKDRLFVRSLIAESLYKSGRNEEALVAFSQIFAETSEKIGSSSEGEFTDDAAHKSTVAPELYSLLQYARSRGFESAERLKESDAQEFLTDDSPFLRAAAGWALLRRQLENATESSQRTAMEELFNHVAADFVRIDAAERAAELSLQLAAIGGPQRLVIGALLPLSGPNRAVGNRALSGILLAQRAFYESGEPAVTLVIQDSYPGLTAGFQALVQQGVAAIVGPLDAAQGAEISALAAAQKIPVMSMVAERSSAPEIREQGIYMFRNFINVEAEARAAARASFEHMKDRRAVVVYPDIGYGRMMASVFAAEFRSLGGQIVLEQSYDRASSDFVRTAKKVAAAKPDAIYIPDSPSKVAELSAFLANENIWGFAPQQQHAANSKRQFVHYLGTSMWHDPVLLRQSSNYLEGALIPVWFSPVLSSPESRAFATRFQSVFGSTPDNFEVFAYDSVLRLRALLLDRGLSEPAAIRDALASQEPFTGATGSFSFDENGEPVRKLRFLTVQKGQLVEYPLSVQTGVR